MSGRRVDFSAAELAAIREAAGLAPDAPEIVCQAAIMLALGMADKLAAEVDQTMDDELEYVNAALRIGHVRWVPVHELEDAPPPPDTG